MLLRRETASRRMRNPLEIRTLIIMATVGLLGTSTVVATAPPLTSGRGSYSEVPMKRRLRTQIIGYTIAALVVASAIVGIADVVMVLES
jgi:hypothetical protein